MRQEIKHHAIRNDPLQIQSRGFQEIIELPSAIAESPDVANRTHRHFDQAARIHEWLRGGLCLHYALKNRCTRRSARFAIGMRGVFRARPFKSEIEQHLLDVRAIRQPVSKPAWGTETDRRSPEAPFDCF